MTGPTLRTALVIARTAVKTAILYRVLYTSCAVFDPLAAVSVSGSAKSRSPCSGGPPDDLIAGPMISQPTPPNSGFLASANGHPDASRFAQGPDAAESDRHVRRERPCNHRRSHAHPTSEGSIGIRIVFITPSFDVDGSGQVDLGDYEALKTCLLGPDGGSSPACGSVDFDGNFTVDLRDFAELQRHFGE